ncbi:MAG: HlyD family type I secretion periplasmic adaptor subunit [Desulfovibrio sp.]
MDEPRMSSGGERPLKNSVKTVFALGERAASALRALRAFWDRAGGPDADVSRATHLLFLLCSLACLSFLLWASFFELDIVSESMGEVIPRTRVKRVQHLEGGIVREILVREGDSVREGQPLISLEEVSSETNVEELQIRSNALRMEIVGLEAAQAGRDAPEYPVDLLRAAPDLVDEAAALFEARKNRWRNELAGYEETYKQRLQDVVEIESRLATLAKNLPLVRRQVARDKDLFAEKLIREDQFIAHQKELNNLLSDIQEQNAALERARSMVTSAEAALHREQEGFSEEIRTALKDARRELGEVEQRLRKFTDIEERTVIRSPVDGVVNSLYIVNEGEVVRPGMTILDIVPAGDRLVVEAHLPVRDIGYVQPGQHAVIRLASGDARRFGSLSGEVAHISPDAVTLEGGETFYRVLVETDKDVFERDGESYRLFPGMRVICAVHTGRRTVLQYLAYPYFNSLSEGLRER